MKELIEVFRMEEVSKETRANILIKLGAAINHEFGANVTEPIIVELVRLLSPEHDILKGKVVHYIPYL